LNAGQPVRVRLFGIDAPQRQQDGGEAAQRFASDAVMHQTVRVIERSTDRYGRTVGIITLLDGRTLNQQIVRAGHAWWYRQHAPCDTDLQALETDARTGKRGLWSLPGQPVAP
jgi:micrococcal nuclease